MAMTQHLLVPRTVTDSFATEVKARIDMQDEAGQIYAVYYSGDGEIEFKNGNHYKGDIQKGLLHGQGQMLFSDGTLYEGMFHLNKMHGQGNIVWPDGCNYQGGFEDGIRHGYGVFQNPLKSSHYEGHWKHGKRHGQGTLKLKDGSIYTGEFEDGVKSGQGKMSYPSGNSYEGNWRNGLKNGQGVMHWVAERQKYQGEWLNDIPHGVGTLIWIENSGINKVLRNRYSGTFRSGLRHGLGIFYYANGSTYEGNWSENKKHGYAIFTDENGEVSHCYFVNDRLVRKIEVTDNLINSFARNKEIKNRYIKYKSKRELLKTEEPTFVNSQGGKEIENTVGTVNTGAGGATSIHARRQPGPTTSPANRSVLPSFSEGQQIRRGTSPKTIPTKQTGTTNPKPKSRSVSPSRIPDPKLKETEQTEGMAEIALEQDVENEDGLTPNIYMKLIDINDFLSEDSSKKIIKHVSCSHPGLRSHAKISQSDEGLVSRLHRN